MRFSDVLRGVGIALVMLAFIYWAFVLAALISPDVIWLEACVGLVFLFATAYKALPWLTCRPGLGKPAVPLEVQRRIGLTAAICLAGFACLGMVGLYFGVIAPVVGLVVFSICLVVVCFWAIWFAKREPKAFL